MLLFFTVSPLVSMTERVQFRARNESNKAVSSVNPRRFSLFVGGELKFQFKGTQHGSVIPVLFFAF